MSLDNFYDQVYTVGCFDHFHQGHQQLLTEMRKYGKVIIAGIHDDASIEKLKNLHPNDHQSLEVRMKNLKPFVDMIYVVAGTDPTIYLQMIDNQKCQSKCYIRADDMKNFPGIDYIKSSMPIFYLPYTSGISSTQIRGQNKGTPCPLIPLDRQTLR